MPSFKTFADFQKKAQEAQASKLDGEVSQQPQEELRIGLPVRVKGLQARPELNGLEGVLTFFDDQKSRWQVELKNGGGAKLFKAANLEHYISDKDALEILKSQPSKDPVRPPVTPAATAKAMPSETVPEPAAAQPDAPKSFLERSRYGKDLRRSGKNLGGKAASRSAVRTDALQESLQEAHLKMAAIDTDVLAKLLDIKAEARSLVAKPGAALARIRCEFFAEMAASWATVATDLGARQRSLQGRACASRPAEGFGSGGVVVSTPTPSPTTKDTPVSRPKEPSPTELQPPLAAQLLRSVSSPPESFQEASPRSSAAAEQARDSGPELPQMSLKARTPEPSGGPGEDSPVSNADELRKMMTLIAAENGGNVEAVLQDHIAKPGGYRTADDKLYASMSEDADVEDANKAEVAAEPPPSELAFKDDAPDISVSAEVQDAASPAAVLAADEGDTPEEISVVQDAAAPAAVLAADEDAAAPAAVLAADEGETPEEISVVQDAASPAAVLAADEDDAPEETFVGTQAAEAAPVPAKVSADTEVLISSDVEQSAVTFPSTFCFPYPWKPLPPATFSAVAMALVQVPNLEEFYQFISERPAGVYLEDLARAGWPDKTQATHLANALLTQSRLDIITVGEKILLKAVAPQLALKLSRLEATTRSVYQQIEKAGDRGAWSKSLKDQTKLQQHTITKAIKELLKQQLIKEVKSVQNRNRKVFMLIDLEPSLEVSGGTWYKDGEFNYSWVETLREYCLTFMDKNFGRPASQAELHRFVMQHPGPQVPTEEDILCIMKTLELDEEVSSLVTSDGQRVFMRRRKGGFDQPMDIFAARLPNFLRQAEGEGRLVVPCLCCPLRNECKAGGRVCPEKCEFLTRWLQPPEDPADREDVLMDWLTADQPASIRVDLAESREGPKRNTLYLHLRFAVQRLQAAHATPPGMATAANAAAKVPVVLESPVGAVLLRFDQHRDGSLQPVWEDPDATPSRCVERLFLEESAAKRRRHEGAGPVESDRERIEFLREAQETALDGVQRATTAAQLLSVGATEGETQFLALQSAVPRPLDFSQIMRHASEVDEAAEAHRQELLDIANARLTNKALQQFKEMEAALSFLGQRWHLHCVAGQYAIELWTGRMRPPKRLLATRPRVRVASHPKKGVCLNFPVELSQLIHTRMRLLVLLRGQGRKGRSQALLPPPWDPSTPRPEALHKALLQAEMLLADALTFHMLRDRVMIASQEELLRQGWQISRVASHEVVLAVESLDFRRLELTVALRAPGAEEVPPPSEQSDPVFDWLADAAAAQLREMYLLPQKSKEASETSSQAPVETEMDLFEAFEVWLQPRVEVLSRYLGDSVQKETQDV
eukprot:s3913_g3.t2